MHRRLTGLMAAGALLVVGPAPAMPAAAMEVILLRHADKDVRRGDYNLSPVGFQRSIALATLIPACFGMPTRITSFISILSAVRTLAATRAVCLWPSLRESTSGSMKPRS